MAAEKDRSNVRRESPGDGVPLDSLGQFLGLVIDAPVRLTGYIQVVFVVSVDCPGMKLACCREALFQALDETLVGGTDVRRNIEAQQLFLGLAVELCRGELIALISESGLCREYHAKRQNRSDSRFHGSSPIRMPPAWLHKQELKEPHLATYTKS